jgi:hypothetical protein
MSFKVDRKAVSSMKSISQLYGAHPGEDIYLIGTGASLRVFPTSFFENKITIGLNMAWKMVSVRYGITVHPELNIPEYMEGEEPHPEVIWATKHNKCVMGLNQEQLRTAEEKYYFFDTDGQVNTAEPPLPNTAGRITDWLRAPDPEHLYMYGTISTTAANLAANMGAKNIILVGCDNCALGNNHHAHQQHTRWLGATPTDRYNDYYEAACEVRSCLRERGVEVLSLNPFMGLGLIPEDFLRLCRELDRPELIKEPDISPSSVRANPFKKAARAVLGERGIEVLKQRLMR